VLLAHQRRHAPQVVEAAEEREPVARLGGVVPRDQVGDRLQRTIPVGPARGDAAHHAHRQLAGVERRLDVDPDRIGGQAQRVAVERRRAQRRREQHGRVRGLEPRREERRRDQVADARHQVGAALARPHRHVDHRVVAESLGQPQHRQHVEMELLHRAGRLVRRLVQVVRHGGRRLLQGGQPAARDFAQHRVVATRRRGAARSTRGATCPARAAPVARRRPAPPARLPGPARPSTSAARARPGCAPRPPAAPRASRLPARTHAAWRWRRTRSCSRRRRRRPSAPVPATGSTGTPSAATRRRAGQPCPWSRVPTHRRAPAAGGRRSRVPAGRTARGRPCPDARRPCRVPSAPAPVPPARRRRR
jgi:hypothetical protein